MKLKAQTPQKGKKIAAVNGKASKVQKPPTPLKTPASLKASNVSIKKIVQPKKKMVEIYEDEDESDEEEEDEDAEEMDIKESDSEDEPVSGNGAQDSDDEENDTDNEDDSVKEEEGDDDEVKNVTDLIDNEAEVDDEADVGTDDDDDEDDDSDEDDDDEEDNDDGNEQEEDEDDEKISTEAVKKGKSKKSLKVAAIPTNDSDDEAPEEAPATTKKSKAEGTSESVPIINFKTIPRGTPDDHIIHLKNLPPLNAYDHGDLANVFSKYGKMTAIVKFPGLKVTTAFVAFTSAEAAAAALEAHRKVTVKGQLIDVSLKKSKNPYCQRNLAAYVGNLTPEIVEGDLREHFAQVGVIKKVTFLGSNKKRFAFIEFADEETLKKALKLNFSKIKDVMLEVKPTNRDDLQRDEKHTIALANTQKLKQYDEEKLKQIFSKCGEVRAVDVLCKSQVLAFISFVDPKSVEKALALNGKTEEDLELKITRYTIEKTGNYIIFITNIYDTTEEYLRKLFSRCGEVGIIKINNSHKTATIQFNDKEAYCKSFLLNEHYINNVPIFIQPFSLKKKLSVKSANLKHSNHNFKKTGDFKFNKKPFNRASHKGGDHFTAPFYRKGGKFENKGPGFKKFPVKKHFPNESIPTPNNVQETKTEVAEASMKKVPKVKQPTQNIESSEPKNAVKRPKKQKNADEGAKAAKKAKKITTE